MRRARPEGPPVIALTTEAFDRGRRSCLGTRMGHWLIKRCPREGLHALLTSWLKHTAVRSIGTPMLDHKPEAGQAKQEVIDRSALDAIRSIQSDAAPDLLVQVVRIYFESAPALIAKLREGFVALDYDAIRTAAHTLKSSSANVGANALAQLCKQLELAARAGSIGPEVPGLSEIEEAYGVAHRALESELEAVQ